MPVEICQQRQRILDEAGDILVTGGPGSGKTTIALMKAQAKIDAGLIAGQSVLFLSFSRAAVARATEASKEHLDRSGQKMLSIQTFHSFFWQVLSSYGYLLGAPRHLRLLQPQDEAALKHEMEDSGGDWAVERERLFTEEGKVVFDLFAPKTAELFQRCAWLRQIYAARHPLIVVDEAQDTADDQWNSVKLLAESTQLLCLADLDQQIYDFRAGVSSERVNDIMNSLSPLRIDFESENHRNATSEILDFANDILLQTPRGSSYSGVTPIPFMARANQRDTTIRQAVGRAVRAAKQATNDDPEWSVAVLASWGKGVNIVSKALIGDGTNSIRHKVAMDETSVLLSSRLIAFLLEPKRPEGSEPLDVAEGLELAATVFRGRGKSTNLTRASELAASALQVRAGVSQRSNSSAGKLRTVIDQLRQHSYTGNPRTDWLHARSLLHNCGGGIFPAIAKDAEQLVSFQRGKRIANNFIDLWHATTSYQGARNALDLALMEDQLLSGSAEITGTHVMTIHKAKGKEFDVVIVYDDSNNSPLLGCAGQEDHPHPRCRRVARVAVTRARHHVFMLLDAFTPSELLRGHRLGS